MTDRINYLGLIDFNLHVVPTALAFSMLGLYFLIRNNKLLNKTNFQLSSLNKTYQVSITDKDLQLKEIHHRIKNNLQLIVSLLNIEAGNNGNNSVDDFLLKGQSRIHSISLIHQNLYETEFNNTINLQNYIEGIIQNLSQIYDNDVDVKINTNQTVIDVDTAIPFGLIITELVCNAFKHAFTDTKSGQIKIDIKKNAKNKLELTLKDNGIGFPKIPSPKIGIGLELVQMMVMQLNGNQKRIDLKGTVYKISF